MPRKDYFERAWLNLASDRNTASMAIRVDRWSCEIEIRDCNRTLSLHSDHMDGDNYKKNRNAFLRKINIMRHLLDNLETEVLERWP